MPIRRIVEHVRIQNWAAIVLDLIVVVVGIFLAFQVDRWYDNRKLLADVGGNLTALANEFSENRDLLEQAYEVHNRAAKSVGEIIAYEANGGDDLSQDDFYEMLRHAYRSTTFFPIRRTYDSLTSTGELEVLSDEDLKTEIAKFYSLVDRLEAYQQRLNLNRNLVLEPYFARKLDHAALMMATHPEAEQLKPSRPIGQFRDVLGNEEFEGLLVAKWHISHDLAVQYSLALDHIDKIQTLIAKNLGESPAAVEE